MTPVFERYAEALYKAALNIGCTDDVAGELLAIEEAKIQSAAYLSNPLVGTRDKAAFIKALLSGKVCPLTLEFILLLTTRRHLKHFRATAEEFRRLSGHGKVVLHLRVPFRPKQSQLEQLKASFKKKKLIPADTEDINLHIIEDKDLIGGFVATCDGYQIDTSLKTTLNKLLRNTSIQGM